ncbi:MAG: amidase [Reyranellaceae bacterium]
MTDHTLSFKSANELARMVREKKIGAVELARHFIGRIERFDGTINAVVVRDFERALQDAKKADEALSAGKATGPLHGVPMTVKESFNLKGHPTTWGAPGFRGNIAAEDAEAVRRLKAAGAIVLGKTNVPFMLGDFQAYNEIYGQTNNPWDVSRTPGGSSGGSAAALAAGMSGLEFGSDIGGSIRNPAHFCGVYGHKPSWNIVPMDGHSLPGMEGTPDLAVVGPLARSADDLSACLDVVAGPGPSMAPGWRLELPAPRTQGLKGLRVAVWSGDDIAPVDAEVTDRLQATADLLAQQGATVSDTARPQIDATANRRAYVALLNSLVGAGVPDEMYEQNKRAAAAFAASDTSRPADMARSMVLDHRAWLGFDGVRHGIRRAWREFFKSWDIMLCPIMATAAFAHDHAPMSARRVTVNGQPQPYFDQIFWASLATLAYLPATVFPAGRSASGLPIGLQAIGPEHGDRRTIAFAQAMARQCGRFAPPPGFDD